MVVCDQEGTLLNTSKVLSTPSEPALAVRSLFESLPDEWLKDARLYHGSTVATNALIERKGPRVGLISTRGFGDVIFIQRQDRDRMFDLKYQRPAQLIAPEDSLEVTERMDAHGNVVVPLGLGQVREIGAYLRDQGIGDVAVCLLHSYSNGTHEEQIRDELRAIDPSLRVSLSSEVAPEFREYERVSTTVVSAYLLERISSYLREVESIADEFGLARVEIMQSNGGMVPLLSAISNPLGMLRSGPAAGVSGAIAAARSAGIQDFVTLDMGGTSTDVALVNDLFVSETTEMMEAGIPVRVPMIDIVAVGAGGGSIARVDAGGLLTVGPESAGASPGPAAYGKGGTLPTVTDANVVIGILRGQTSLSDDLHLDTDASWSSFEELSGELGLTVPAVAEQVTRLASASMAGAIRVATVEKGASTDGHALVVYGGAGPMHAAEVAEELQLDTVLVPPYNGLTSAYGLLTSDFRRYFSRTTIRALHETQWSHVLADASALREHGVETLEAEGIDTSQVTFTMSIDMRYRGQGYELNVSLAEDSESLEAWLEEFHRLHETKYGYSNTAADVQAITIRVRADGASVTPRALILERSGELALESGEIIESGSAVSCTYCRRSALPVGFHRRGPMVIEDETSTTYVPTSWSVTVDSSSNLVLRK